MTHDQTPYHIKQPKNLSSRIQWLRDYYFQGVQRRWNNEMTAWTTGTPWDFQYAGAFGDELRAIPKGASLAVFGMSMSMETVLLRGTFQGVRRVGGLPCGTVAVDWVYNPMPPTAEQIYPAMPLEPVRMY